jgi:hypothetical protein
MRRPDGIGVAAAMMMGAMVEMMPAMARSALRRQFGRERSERDR